MIIDISHIQYLNDSNGLTSAVQIPIEDWIKIEKQVFSGDIPSWHQSILNQRIDRAIKKPESMQDFESFMKEIEDEL